MAWLLIVSALLMLFAGLWLGGGGSFYGWILAAAGAVNTVVGFVLLRRSSRPLS
jgi:hypothetical protein